MSDAAHSHPISRDEAARLFCDHLKTAILPRFLEGKNSPVLLVSLVPLRPGQLKTPLSIPGKEIELHPDGSWVGFLDLMPNANWGHPAQYLFLDPDQSIRAVDAIYLPSSVQWAFRVEARGNRTDHGVTWTAETKEYSERELAEQWRYLVDAAVTIGKNEIILIRRAHPPFEDKLVLPGGHVEPTDPNLSAACARELAEEIGLMVDPGTLEHLKFLDRPGRDPRPGHDESHVYTLDLPSRDAIAGCTAGSDARAIEICRIADLTEADMGFDHYDAIVALRARLAGEYY